VIRIRTTGGGGWGDPLDRPHERVLEDVRSGKVSRAGAVADYGVVISGPDDDPAVDSSGTATLRTSMRQQRDGEPPFFDRGPGFARLAGAAAAEWDWL
jgi:N-methylhydantoinase B